MIIERYKGNPHGEELSNAYLDGAEEAFHRVFKGIENNEECERCKGYDDEDMGAMFCVAYCEEVKEMKYLAILRMITEQCNEMLEGDVKDAEA